VALTLGEFHKPGKGDDPLTLSQVFDNEDNRRHG